MNFQNSQTLDFAGVRNLIENSDDGDEFNHIIVSEMGITRTSFHDVITRKAHKTVRPVYTKRWFVNSQNSYSYGFKF